MAVNTLLTFADTVMVSIFGSIRQTVTLMVRDETLCFCPPGGFCNSTQKSVLAGQGLMSEKLV